MLPMSSDDRVPSMTDDLSRFLLRTTSRETAGGGCSAPKLDDVVVVHKLLSSSAACTGSRGAPFVEETLQHPRPVV